MIVSSFFSSSNPIKLFTSFFKRVFRVIGCVNLILFISAIHTDWIVCVCVGLYVFIYSGITEAVHCLWEKESTKRKAEIPGYCKRKYRKRRQRKHRDSAITRER